MQRITIFAMQGNTRVVTGGVSSTTLVEGSFPSCTVSVFATGTTNLATIFGDNLFPPTPKSNPFTADSTGSGFFYAVNGTRVDIQLSGTGIAAPFTLAGDVLVNDLSLTTISAPVTIPFAASPAFDLSQADWFQITLTGNVTTPTFPNPVAGSVLIMTIIQDGTGGRTFAWPGSFLLPPAIFATAGAATDVTFKFDGVNWRVWTSGLGSVISNSLITIGNVSVGGTLGVTGTSSHTGNATFGANVLIKGPVPWADVTQYGLLGDGATDNTAAFNSMMTTLCASNQAHTVYFPITAGGNYLFNSAPNAIGCEVVIRCSYDPVQWNPTGVDSAQLTANYTEATPTNAFISFTGSTSPGNSGIQGCSIWKGLGKTGGTAIKYTGTSTTQRAGGGPIQDVRISGDGTWNWGLRVDCTNITTAGSPGCRDIVLRNFNSFQTTTGCMSLNNAVHFNWEAGACLPTGGNGHVDVTGLVTANAQSINVEFLGVEILDTLALDFVGISGNPGFTCAGCTVNALTATANTVLSNFSGISINPPVNSGQLSYQVLDNLAGAAQGTTLVDGLRAKTFITAGPAIISNAGVGDVISNSSATSGNIRLGSDGNMTIRRNNGSGSGSNIAITFDAFSTTPFNFDTTNGFSTTRKITSSLATGTAPLVITSTTPVANLSTTPTTYNAAGTQQVNTHVVQDTCTLGTNCAVTLVGSAVFTNATSYTCVCEDDSAIAACRVSQTSGSAFTITGTGTDVIRYVCIGS
jgi:hypothetical protein